MRKRHDDALVLAAAGGAGGAPESGAVHDDGGLLPSRRPVHVQRGLPLRAVRAERSQARAGAGVLRPVRRLRRGLRAPGAARRVPRARLGQRRRLRLGPQAHHAPAQQSARAPRAGRPRRDARPPGVQRLLRLCLPPAEGGGPPVRGREPHAPHVGPEASGLDPRQERVGRGRQRRRELRGGLVDGRPGRRRPRPPLPGRGHGRGGAGGGAPAPAGVPRLAGLSLASPLVRNSLRELSA
mmetsp:Transcript_37925/g.82667  ORF Transcript_37925/g.82667 Transcript_37925/m.82667 type:complete len:239 (-) Transcript_37925:491-1207(-)